MGPVDAPEDGYVACSNDGCARPARSQLRPGLCAPCQSRESYHRKNPGAPRKPVGHHGQWKGKSCTCGEPVSCRGMCKACYRKQYAAPKYSPERLRARRIKSRYGITQQQYEVMVAERSNRCDVCLQEPTARNTRAHWDGKLCIDHCHETGKVRGLLCNDCNLAVGYGKSPEILERAAAYLRVCG